MDTKGSPDTSRTAASDQPERWFIEERPSPYAGEGFIHVAGPMEKALAERIANEKRAARPQAHIHIWEHPEDVRHRLEQPRMGTKGISDTSRTAPSDEAVTVIPGKPAHRIVLLSPEEAYYEHVETGERTRIALAPVDTRALRAVAERWSRQAPCEHEWLPYMPGAKQCAKCGTYEGNLLSASRTAASALPDFEQMAREIPIMSCEACAVGMRCAADGIHYEKSGATWGVCRTIVAEIRVAARLRQVWNARGDADRATIERELSSQMGATASGPYVKNLDRSLRTLDVGHAKETKA